MSSPSSPSSKYTGARVYLEEELLGELIIQVTTVPQLKSVLMLLLMTQTEVLLPAAWTVAAETSARYTACI